MRENRKCGTDLHANEIRIFERYILKIRDAVDLGPVSGTE